MTKGSLCVGVGGREEQTGQLGGRKCVCKGPEVGHSMVLSKAEKEGDVAGAHRREAGSPRPHKFYLI